MSSKLCIWHLLYSWWLFILVNGLARQGAPIILSWRCRHQSQTLCQIWSFLPRKLSEQKSERASNTARGPCIYFQEVGVIREEGHLKQKCSHLSIVRERQYSFFDILIFLILNRLHWKLEYIWNKDGSSVKSSWCALQWTNFLPSGPDISLWACFADTIFDFH